MSVSPRPMELPPFNPWMFRKESARNCKGMHKLIMFALRRLEQLNLRKRNDRIQEQKIINGQRSGFWQDCWGKGTRIMKYDGTSVNVEDIKVGDTLMGADSSCRKVTELVRGQKPLFTVKPTFASWDSWKCSPGHILSLVIDIQPCKAVADGKPAVKFFVLRDDGRPVLKHRGYKTSEERDIALYQQQATWKPIYFDATAEEYAKFPNYLKTHSKLYRPDIVHFGSKQEDSLAARLARCRTGANISDATSPEPNVSVSPSDQDVPSGNTSYGSMNDEELTAWIIGMWLADGHKHRRQALVSQSDWGGDHTSSHIEIHEALLEWHRRIYGKEGQKTLSKTVVSQDGFRNDAYTFNMGRVLGQILDEYNIFQDKALPQSLLTESVVVRRHILAGLIDGDGTLKKRKLQSGEDVLRIGMADQPMIESVRKLARSLGISVGSLSKEERTLEEGGPLFTLWSITLIGGSIYDLPTICAGKRVKRRENVQMTHQHLSTHFSIEQESKHPEAYFGVRVDGDSDKRLLLEDFTVTHNCGTVQEWLLQQLLNIMHKHARGATQTLEYMLTDAVAAACGWPVSIRVGTHANISCNFSCLFCFEALPSLDFFARRRITMSSVSSSSSTSSYFRVRGAFFADSDCFARVWLPTTTQSNPAVRASNSWTNRGWRLFNNWNWICVAGVSNSCAFSQSVYSR